jgi:hypothetical protein
VRWQQTGKRMQLGPDGSCSLFAPSSTDICHQHLPRTALSGPGARTVTYFCHLAPLRPRSSNQQTIPRFPTSSFPLLSFLKQSATKGSLDDVATRPRHTASGLIVVVEHSPPRRRNTRQCLAILTHCRGACSRACAWSLAYLSDAAPR